MPSDTEDDSHINASDLIEEAWKEFRRSLYVQSRIRGVSTGLPDVSFEEASRRASVGASLLRRLEKVDRTRLSHDLTLTLRLVRFYAGVWAREADWYWTVVDPLGIGLFGLFLPTAYCGGFLLNFVHKQFATAPLRGPSDAERYLSLVGDYARLINQFTARTAGQMTRGIFLPKLQVTQARSLLTALHATVRAKLLPAPDPSSQPWRQELIEEVEERVSQDVEPAFDAALAQLSDAYLNAAPERVGMDQYPHGAEIYAHLVRIQTTLDLTPAEVHARGLARMQEIEESIRLVESELGFGGDPQGLQAHLDNDPQWRANTVEGVTAVFERYIERLKPRFAEAFWDEPKAGYGVAPLAQSLQGAMTYGYYEPPNRERSSGLYLFNAANLTRQPLFSLAALTYHELMPGHHLQFALQQENMALHPLRAQSFVNAYIEGWAEYAATWAGEIGLYASPAERYGRLLQDAFLTSRLVVDTGMNVLGWSLQQARDYMRHHSRVSESEIMSETLRYACDIPAQALAYKLGDTRIVEMRERMREALGARFDIKAFHAAVLASGPLPLLDLEYHIEHEIAVRSRVRA